MATFASRFISDNNPLNPFDGLQHGGMAEVGRHTLTPFGSKKDRLRIFADMLRKPFEKLVESRSFKKALGEATVVERLGSGSFGDTHLMKTVFKGKEFLFARKTLKPNIREWVLQRTPDPSVYLRSTNLLHEAAMTRPLGRTTNVPSVYAATKDTLDMEYLPGNILGKLKKGTSVREGVREELLATVNIMEKKGIANQDIHWGNIMYDPSSKRAGFIDFGQAQRVRPSAARASARITRNKINAMFNKLDDATASTVPKEPISKLSTMVAPPAAIPPRATPITAIEGMRHGGQAEISRHKFSDHGSRWKGLFGGISQKISKFFATGVREGVEKLLDPRKAAGLARGATLEDFVKKLGSRGVIARDEAGERIFSQMVQQAPGLAGGAAHTTFANGQSAIMMSPSRLRSTFSDAAARLGMDPKKIEAAVNSEDFLKTVFYHEHLEQQVAGRFSILKKMPTHHNSSHVLMGEGGFVDSLGNAHVKELFTTIRKARPEEYAAFTAGIEGFGEKGVAARFRKWFSDFGSGYRGLLDSTSIEPARALSSSSGRARKKLTNSSKDLKIAQRELATPGGNRHRGYVGKHVTQLYNGS